MNDIELISLMRRDGTVLATLPGENDCFCTGLFLEPFTILEAWSIPEVESVFTEVETLLGEGCHIAGFISYEASPAFDREQKVLPDGQFPLLRLACYRKSPEKIRLPYRNDFYIQFLCIKTLQIIVRNKNPSEAQLFRLQYPLFDAVYRTYLAREPHLARHARQVFDSQVHV